MKMNTYSDFVAHLTIQLRHLFDDKLLNVFQLGSLSHGGFSERFSDIDIAVVLSEPATNDVIADVKQQILNLEPNTLAKRVSLFWTVPDFSWGRLRPVDQLDFLDNRQCLWGEPLQNLPPRPSLDLVRSDMLEHSLPYWSSRTQYFAQNLPNDEKEFKEFVRCLLYPARLIFTWQLGKLGSNDEAVEYFAQVAPTALRRDMVEDALRCRKAEIDDELLFQYQAFLIAQHEATLAFLKLEKK
ncbi:hypothetical protein [Candidatus Albibeggiatoa sp. nov. BB20]|uniref:hypothetical protein n=1 Tax=Candidatus Albibeggiatoa sp. nov. BB20 TaxID=3162723 RepID=UPI0033657925